jgi:hypothetical protein
VGKKGPSYTAGRNVNYCNHYGKHYECYTQKKTKIELPYDLALSPLRIYPKECKSGYNKETYTTMFIGALVTITNLLK